jgi:hypothetical protein
MMGNMRMFRAAIAIGVAGWLAMGAGTPRARAADAPVSLAAEGTNQFAYNLYARLSDRDGGATKLFFSPYSIESAPAMTYAGARAQTADEILWAIDFPMPPGGGAAIQRRAACNAGVVAQTG